MGLPCLATPPRGVRIFAPALLSALMLAAAMTAAPVPAYAQQPAAAAAATAQPLLVTPGDMRSGALLFRSTEEGKFVEAPRLMTDIAIDVSGPVARAKVTQRFENPSEAWAEGVYVFPLPEGAAVDRMRLQIGDRLIEGKIKEREEARAIYEDAKREGKKASLLEQERANVFTTSVANIGPKETVVVQIEYQEQVRLDGGTFKLRMPLVVAPRYKPAPSVQTVDFQQGGGWGRVGDPVPDRDRISPPVLDPRENARVNPVTLAVNIRAGFPLAEAKSAFHEIAVDRPDKETALVKLEEDAIPADRDFELVWTAEPKATPSAGLFQEQVKGETYLLAFVTPPAAEALSAPRKREVVFVFDHSGSMAGASMPQAKAALISALDRLKPEDRFNVIRFDHTNDSLFSDTVPATPENVGRAKGWVQGTEPDGGTEIVPALTVALQDPRPDDKDTVRQVIFLTDGAIGNEQQLFDTLARGRGRSRVFMIGIGSAPNSFLMQRASEIGRGTFTHIGSEAQVKERMEALYAKLERPAATGLSVRWDGAGPFDVTPDPLPDLYVGEPLVLTARLEKPAGTLVVDGETAGKPWQIRLPIAGAVAGNGTAKLWARRKIDQIELAGHLDRIGEGKIVDDAVARVALEHGLVSRRTSLVAVDVTPSRPAGDKLVKHDMPVNLPAGWEFGKVFGEAAKPAAPMQRAQLTRQVALMAAAPPPPAYATTASRNLAAVAAAPNPGVDLPDTATSADRLIIGGMATLALAGLLALLLVFMQGRGLGLAGRRE